MSYKDASLYPSLLCAVLICPKCFAAPARWILDLFVVKSLEGDYVIHTAVNLSEFIYSYEFTYSHVYCFSVDDAAGPGAVQTDGATAVYEANQRT